MSESLNSVLSHILSQTRENISLLASLKQISAHEANELLSKLPKTPISVSGDSLDRFPLAIGAAPTITLFKVKALWGYNEDGKETNDLPFTPGEVIEVIDETNADWWRGRLKGKEGLFPSSYVERLAFDPATRPVPPPPNASIYKGPSPNFPSGPGYSAPYPYGPQQQQSLPPPQNYYGPPPPPPPSQYGPYPPYAGPPQQQPPPVVINSGDQPQKKPGMFSGGLGNTLAHSAVGGAGFGAGSALAGNLVNAIF